MNKKIEKIQISTLREAKFRIILASLMFISLIFMLNPVSAGSSGGDLLGKQGNCINLPQECADCTYVNVTTITYPNLSQVNLHVPMTQSGSSFNYSFCNTALLGSYIYCTIGDVSGTDTTVCKDFEVTYTGDIISTESAYIYIVALIFLVLLMLGLAFITTRLPSRDAVDEEGTIIQVSLLKHLRPVIWSVIWIIGIACIWIISNLGIAYLSNAMIGKLFFTIYRILFYFTMIALPIYFVFLFIKIFRDRQMKEMIERGVEFKGSVF